MNLIAGLLILIPLLLISTLSAATTPAISLRHPRDGSTTSAKRIRFGGVTTPGATLTVNGVQTLVASTGGFAGLIDLVPGENVIHVVVSLGGESAEASAKVTCTRPAIADPNGTVILEDSVLPNVDLEIRPNDPVTVSFRGTSGRSATFGIDGLCIGSSMAEVSGEDGYSTYIATYRTGCSEKARSAGVVVSLARDGEETTRRANGKLTIVDGRSPVVGEVTREMAVVRTGPQSTWDMLWPKGIRAEISGREGEMLRLSMPGGKEGWIHESSMQILAPGTPVPRAGIGTVIVKITDYGVRISLGTAVRLPYEIVQTVDPSVIELTIYGGHADTDWLSRPIDGMIREIQWKQPAQDVYTLRVLLNGRQQWGFDTHYEDGALVLEIKRPPKLAAAPASPLRGLIIAVDAGHGGEELGAVGPAGLQEKVVNLDIASMLAKKLRAKGARPVLLRDKDVTVPLMDRPEKAAASGADILISVHNNSVPGTADPVKIRGTSSYWYHPQAMALSECIHRRALETGLPDFGNVYSNLAIIRPHRMLAALIEGGFMSSPEEEALLGTREFREKLADAVLLGIEDFLKNVRENP